MIVELGNKFRFECDGLQEMLDVNKRAMLKLTASNLDLNTSLTATSVAENFTESNCNTIKIFKSDASTVPMIQYKDYKYLNYFDKTFNSNQNKFIITIVLSTVKN